MPSRLHAQSKSPYVLAACSANITVGTLQLATGNLPKSVEESAPLGSVSTMWSILLIMGGIACLVGIFTKPTSLGLRLEGAGHVGMGAGCLVYVVALLIWVDVWWPQPAFWWAVALTLAAASRWYLIVSTIHRANKLADKRESKGVAKGE